MRHNCSTAGHLISVWLLQPGLQNSKRDVTEWSDSGTKRPEPPCFLLGLWDKPGRNVVASMRGRAVLSMNRSGSMAGGPGLRGPVAGLGVTGLGADEGTWDEATRTGQAGGGRGRSG